MDRLTEFVSKSFDGQSGEKEESVENNNVGTKGPAVCMDMSKETLDRESALLHSRETVDVDVDVDVTAEDDATSETERPDSGADRASPPPPPPRPTALPRGGAGSRGGPEPAAPGTALSAAEALLLQHRSRNTAAAAKDFTATECE